jgi:WD40 repeat protein
MRFLLQVLMGVAVFFCGASWLVADDLLSSKAALQRDALPPGAVARLGATSFRKGYFVTQLQFCPDGKTLVTSGHGQGVVLWDASSGKMAMQISSRRGNPVFALSPDGMLLATRGKAPGAAEEELIVFDAGGKVVRRLDRSLPWTLAFSSDQGILASAGLNGQGAKTLCLWDVTTGKVLHELPIAKGHFTRLLFAPQGNLLAGCAPYGPAGAVVHLWDGPTGKEVPPLQGHAKAVHALAFSPGGELLLSGSQDETIRVWDLQSRKNRQVLRTKHGPVDALAFAADGRLFASAHEDGYLVLWAADKRQPIREWRGHTATVMALAFSPDGQTLVSVGSSDGRPSRWSVATGEPLDRNVGHRGAVEWLAWADDGKSLLSLGREKALLRWDPKTEKSTALWRLPAADLSRLEVAPDRKTVAALGSEKGDLTLWDAGGNAPPRSLGTPRRPSNWQTAALCFSPDGRLLAVSRDNLVLFELASGKERFQAKLSGPQATLAFSPDGKVLAVAESGGASQEDGTLRFLDTTSGQELLRVDTPHFAGQLTFSPSGRWLAGAGDYQGALQVWDITAGKTVLLQGTPASCYGAAFSSDSRFLSAAGTERDPVTRIWELPGGKELVRLAGNESYTVTFSPDDKTLATGSSDGSLLLWDWQSRVPGGVAAGTRFPDLLATAPLLAGWPKTAPFRYPEAKHGRGELKYINGLPVLFAQGTPEEIGAQIGALGLKPIVANLDVPHLVDEVLKSHNIRQGFPWLKKFCNALFYRFPKEYRREVEAMAKASGLDPDLLVILNLAPDLYRLPGCSTLIVEPAKSATGKPLFGRNLDTAPVMGLYKYSLVIVYRQPGKHAFVSIGFPGTVGPMSAMNDAGLALATNGIYATADGSPPFNPAGMPLFLLYRRLMEEATSVAETEKFVRAHLPATMLSMTACDKSGGAVFELTSKTCLVHSAEAGICCCTNHFVGKGLTTSTPCWRYPLLEESRSMARLNVADVSKKMDSVNQGGWTVQTMIFEPADLRVHVAFGRGPTSALPLKVLELGTSFR